MRDLRRLIRYLLRHRWTLVSAVLAALLAAAFLAAAVGLVNPLLAALAPTAQPRGESPELDRAAVAEAARARLAQLPRWTTNLIQGGRDALQPIADWISARPHVRLPLIIVTLYALKALLFCYADFSFRRVGLLATTRMREELYARSLNQSDAFFMRHSTGEMISRILGDVARLQTILGSDIGQLLQSGPAAAAMLAVAFWQAWQVTLVCLIVIPVFAVAASRFGAHVRKAARRSQEQTAALVAQTEEALLARRVVQAYNAEASEIQRFGATLARTLRQELRVVRSAAATPAVLEIIGAASGAVILVFASQLTRGGLADPKSVFVAVVALGVVFTHVRRLGQLNTTVQQALASARRVFEILDEPVAVQDRPGAIRLPPFQREIRFSNVSFSYDRGPVLADVNLVIGAGEVHALVGPSGAGKTTLAMLIPRFVDPTAGQLMIDGVDLRNVSLASLRAQIALVTQDTHLFDGAVAANIAFGSPHADREAVVRAARAAHADEFIARLPLGYETPLGERGSQLSAGQRQRVAIARAFLKDAPILILDEATSALDSSAEREVQRALEALLAGRTALIIAHRLSTVARADWIHVLEAGRIVESGGHKDLLRRDGPYARLHQLQQT